MYVPGVDASYGRLTPDIAYRLHAVQGIPVFQQCLWTGQERPQTAIDNLRVARDAEMLIAGYISVSASHDGSWHVGRGRDGVPDDLWDYLLVVPIDAELPGLKYHDHMELAWDAIAALGKPQDVYTNYNTWMNILGNPTHRPGVRLQNAYWDSNPNVNFESLPFGGWTIEELLGEQWSGGVNLEGILVDRSTFNVDLLMPPEPAPPEEPLPDAGAFAQTMVSAGHNRRMGYDFETLPWADEDRSHIRWLAKKVG